MAISKRINNDNYNVWRKSTSQHFDLGAVISSLLKTLPLALPDSDSAGHVGCIDGRGREGVSGVMILLRRRRSAAKGSYSFVPERDILSIVNLF